ncbi:hypothetical protein CYMTET_54881, partial [Cymbomonas tetramitiformis]
GSFLKIFFKGSSATSMRCAAAEAAARTRVATAAKAPEPPRVGRCLRHSRTSEQSRECRDQVFLLAFIALQRPFHPAPSLAC